MTIFPDNWLDKMLIMLTLLTFSRDHWGRLIVDLGAHLAGARLDLFCSTEQFSFWSPSGGY